MSAMRVFLSYGFRPFFLLCGAWAIVPLAVLVAVLVGMPWNAEALPLFRWHGHEMIFGFVAAAIAGFLLTASATWTGTPPIAGGRLAALALLWLAGRFVVSPMTGLHSTAAVLVEIAFLPVLGAMLAVPLVRTRNVRNYPFLVILALLAAADALFHAIALGLVRPPPFDPLRFAANLVMLIVAIVGVVAIDIVAPESLAAGLAAAASAVLVAAQLARWEGFKTIRMPIVFVLHVGYAWIAIALALKALWILAGAPWAVNWLHAQTAGLFGTMILAVATRVALGHTGRPLVVRPAITVAYALVAAAALVRIFGPALLPLGAVHVLACAAVLWAAAFGIFLVVYVPILFAPRAA
ncbi:MAG: NnrS family protein [Gammaproteobacteria bacterium]